MFGLGTTSLPCLYNLCASHFERTSCLIIPVQQTPAIFPPKRSPKCKLICILSQSLTSSGKCFLEFDLFFFSFLYDNAVNILVFFSLNCTVSSLAAMFVWNLLHYGFSQSHWTNQAVPLLFKVGSSSKILRFTETDVADGVLTLLSFSSSRRSLWSVLLWTRREFWCKEERQRGEMKLDLPDVTDQSS